MTTALNTTKIANRRKLHFASTADILADLNTLTAAPNLQHLGNWTPGQIFLHLAKTINYSIDGFPDRMPTPVIFLLRTFMKTRILNSPMTPGFKAPKAAAALMPPPTATAEGLNQLRAALNRYNTETKRSPSPFLGQLTADEWTKLHCRHCELHLSFLVPAQ